MHKDGRELDHMKDAYEKECIFYKENEFMMKYYANLISSRHNSGKALDLGFGHGLTPVYFSKVFDKYVVVEGSQEIINEFEKQYSDHNIEIHHSYFEDFESDELFDVIILGFVLEHVDDPFLILNKYKELLAANGSIYVVVPNYEFLNRRIGFEAGIIKELHYLSDFDLAAGHKRAFTVESLNDLISDAGLKTVLVEGIYLKPIATSQMIQLQFDDNIFSALMKLGKNYPELSVAIFAHLKKQ